MEGRGFHSTDSGYLLKPLCKQGALGLDLIFKRI